MNLSSPERVEQLRRSVAMLSPGQPALDREDALKVLAALEAAMSQEVGAAHNLRLRAADHTL